ncbi:maltose regulon periplasmic protein [Serratia rubidaea]|uniref:Maltose regulon periplasmic protein n=1 Tax=Serratia rubidaea TaxID=61652 RepID=A0A447QK41_SERRU|nr:maltose regulon periplasmic protein [Serratia rubidaea]
MNKTLLSFYLSAALAVSLSPIAKAATPADVAVAPAVSAATLQNLPWQPLVPPATQQVTLNEASRRFTRAISRARWRRIRCRRSRLAGDYLSSIAGIIRCMRRACWCWTSSGVRQPTTQQLFSVPAAGRNVGGPAGGHHEADAGAGAKQIYLLVYTTRQDLSKTTQLTNPAKAYARGVGNAVPDIPILSPAIPPAAS